MKNSPLMAIVKDVHLTNEQTLQEKNVKSMNVPCNRKWQKMVNVKNALNILIQKKKIDIDVSRTCAINNTI